MVWGPASGSRPGLRALLLPLEHADDLIYDVDKGL